MPFGFSSSAKHPNVSTVCTNQTLPSDLADLTSLTLLQNGTEKGQRLPSNLAVTLLQSGTEKGHGDPSPGNGGGGPAPASEDWPPPGVEPEYVGCMRCYYQVTTCPI